MPQDQKKRQQKLLKQRRKEKAKKKHAHRYAGTGESDKTVVKNARTYPILECLIRPDWRETLLTPIWVARKQPSGNITYGVFLVDLGCLGVKDAFYRADIPPLLYAVDLKAEFVEANDAEPCPPLLAHQIIYGAINYAANLGFKPHKDYGWARYVLDDEASIEPNPDIEFGKGGKPYYHCGPHDDQDRIMKHLTKTLGPGNFHYLVGGPLVRGEDEEIDEEYGVVGDADDFEDDEE